MSLTIEIEPQIEARLRAQAVTRGVLLEATDKTVPAEWLADHNKDA